MSLCIKAKTAGLSGQEFGDLHFDIIEVHAFTDRTAARVSLHSLPGQVRLGLQFSSTPWKVSAC